LCQAPSLYPSFPEKLFRVESVARFIPP